MTWFRVDDKLHDHRKVRTAGVQAMGLWVLAGSWAADHLTDGFVPASVASRWSRRASKLADRLVAAGLWIPDEQNGEPGWRFHQWDRQQPTRAEVEDVRAKRAEAGRLGGIASGITRRANQPSTNQQSNTRSKDEANASSVVEANAKQNRTPSRPVPYRGPVVDQGPVVSDATRRAGFDTIMRKLGCDEAWAAKTAERFDALATGPIRDHGKFYGKCIDEHIRQHGLDSLKPTPVPKRPKLCEHGVPMNADCEDCRTPTRHHDDDRELI